MNFLVPTLIMLPNEKKMLRQLYTGDAYERSIDCTVNACWSNIRYNKYGCRQHDSLEKYLKGFIKPHFPVPMVVK